MLLLGTGALPASAGDDKLDKRFLEVTLLAAEKGDAAAQCAIGACFESGTGMLKDYEEAAKWYRRAAVQGDAMAQCALGACHERGRGVKRDVEEAAKWYLQAATQGFARAAAKMGEFYRDGTGVKRDLVQSWRWYTAAAAAGDETSRKAAAALGRKLKPAELAAARQEAGQAPPHEPPLQGFAAVPAPSTAATPPPGGVSAVAVVPPAAIPRATGTGFFITTDGYLITSARVLEGNPSSIELVTKTGRIPAMVVKLDVADDLALLKTAGQFTPLPIVPSRSVKTGARVALAAFLKSAPEGSSPIAVKGRIEESPAGNDPRFFRVSVPLTAEGAGGAVTDERGNVVGVISGAAAAQSGLPEGVQPAVRSSFLLGFLESVPEVAAQVAETHAAGAPDPENGALPAGSVLVLAH